MDVEENKSLVWIFPCAEKKLKTFCILRSLALITGNGGPAHSKDNRSLDSLAIIPGMQMPWKFYYLNFLKINVMFEHGKLIKRR